jgi:DNA helicase-2/ATP-dependent DNA helicase PcrA
VATIPAIKGKGATGLRDFHKLITELRARLDIPPHDLIRLVLDKSGYAAALRESGDEEDATRLENVEELVTAAKQFHDQNPDRTIGDFLEQITLASDVDGWDEQADHVSVMMPGGDFDGGVAGLEELAPTLMTIGAVSR